MIATMFAVLVNKSLIKDCDKFYEKKNIHSNCFFGAFACLFCSIF